MDTEVYLRHRHDTVGTNSSWNGKVFVGEQFLVISQAGKVPNDLANSGPRLQSSAGTDCVWSVGLI